jgi:diguanylate cyclase
LAFRAQLREILGVLFKTNKRIAQLEDLVEEKDKEAKIDLLTGLPGRRAFNESVPGAVRTALEASPDMPYPVSYLMIDIDNFKQVNDIYGHNQADLVLKRIAEIIQENVPRDSDFVCRLGGEEFTVILFNCPIENALQIAEKIRIAAENEIFNLGLSGDTVRHQSTITIGVASKALHNELRLNENEVIFELSVIADAAMYKGKEEGRNQVVSMEDLSPELISQKKEEALKLASNS